MAVSKLSQITPAGSPPALTDQLVGVTGGTTDNLITPQQLAETFQAGGIVRTLLQADQAVNVNSATGSDSITLAQALAGSAFATLQHAWDFLTAELDLGSFTLTINEIGAGPYVLGANSGWVAGADVVLLGEGSTVTSATIFFGNETTCILGPNIVVDGQELIDTGAFGGCLQSFALGQVALGTVVGDVAFGPASLYQISWVNTGASLFISNNITLNAGTSGSYISVASLAFVSDNGNYTIVGAPAYTAFVQATEAGLYEQRSTSYSGSLAANTLQFFVGQGGQINPQTPGINTLPGDITGYVLPGGIYAFLGTQNIQTPSSGDTVAVSNAQPDTILTPGGSLISLTISSPALFGSETGNGYEFSVSTTQAIASLLSSAPDGASFVGFPSSLAANTGFRMIYDAPTTTWYLMN